MLGLVGGAEVLTVLSQALRNLPVSEAGRKWVRSPYAADNVVGRDRQRSSDVPIGCRASLRGRSATSGRPAISGNSR